MTGPPLNWLRIGMISLIAAVVLGAAIYAMRVFW